MPSKKDKRFISEMRNFGSACERDFESVRIVYAYQVVNLGAKKAFIEMLRDSGIFE